MKQLNDLTFNTTLKAQNNNYNIAQWKPNNLTSIQNNIFHKKDNLFYYFFFFFLLPIPLLFLEIKISKINNFFLTKN